MLCFFFDTEPNYAETKSERILGKALKNKRDSVVLVSKFGHTPAGPKVFSVDWFWQSLDASLGRLRTDYLDVLLLYNPPREIYAGTDPVWAAIGDVALAPNDVFFGSGSGIPVAASMSGTCAPRQ